MNQTLAGALALCSLIAVSTLAHAAPVNYSESTGGDLAYNVQTGAITTFTFDAGANTVSGTFSSPQPPLPSDSDADHFAFIIPSGHQLTGGQVSLVDVSGNINDSRWDLYNGHPQTASIIANLVVTSPGTVAIPAQPAGSYSVFQSMFGGTGISSYTFTFNVAPIPEPSSVVLLALGSLAAVRRRR